MPLASKEAGRHAPARRSAKSPLLVGEGAAAIDPELPALRGCRLVHSFPIPAFKERGNLCTRATGF
jgi:hypothetical protein